MNNKSNYIAQGALVASLYILLTLASNIFGMAGGIIQIRLSEALTILPIFTPAAIPGLFVGCVISNIITGCMPLDVILGALATLAGGYGTYVLRRNKFMACLPPIMANTLILPWILSAVYKFEGSILYFIVTILIGEAISAGVLGLFLAKSLEPYRDRLGWNNAKNKK